MHARTWLSTLTFLTLLGTAPATRAAPDEGVRAIDGVWIYVQDRTEGRASEDQQPSMSTRVTLRVETDAVVLVRSDGEIRMALDGTPTEIASEFGRSRYRGAWKDGAFAYDIEMLRADGTPRGVIQTELRPTAEGLVARVALDPPAGMSSVALYRHAEDIPLPEPARATIDGLSWLAGAWVGSTSRSSIEERWSPPLGGAMLGVSRTVSRGSMRAFEYLRVVERNGGLVYVAQPNGKSPAEFALTELTATRAVFENPRHDFPQRIVYELAEGGLTASIGFTRGGRPQRFAFTRESN